MAHERGQTRTSRRIAPEPGTCGNIIEIRPNRTLHVKHLNPKERDEKFQKEMQAYLQYREIGALGAGRSVPSHLLSQRHNNSTAECSAREKSVEEETAVIKDDRNIAINNDKENSDYLNSSRGKIELVAPSRNSLHSQGGQSASGVHVAVARPSSEVNALGQIGESNQEVMESELHLNSPHKLSKSPHKTKDHRPVSARSYRRGAKPLGSTDLTNTLSTDLGHTAVTHLDSPYKNITLFFIHGVGGSSDIWNAQMEFFTSLDLEVIAPDLIGIVNFLTGIFI